MISSRSHPRTAAVPVHLESRMQPVSLWPAQTSSMKCVKVEFQTIGYSRSVARIEITKL